MLTITLTNEDSEVLDSVEVSRDELIMAQRNGLAACHLLGQLTVGA